jgi:hypothetical protein
MTPLKVPATLNSYDQKAIEPFVRDWRYRHGELRACHAHWEVREDGKVRWFPAKVIDLHFADAHGQVRIDAEIGKTSVAVNPHNKPKPPKLDALEPRKSDAPTYGMTGLEWKAA